MRDSSLFKGAACALGAVCLPLTLLTPVTAAAPVRYVALGDSYTSAPFVSRIRPGSPPKCRRSEHNYPGRLAARLHASSFTDVSCSGAALRHMTTAQGENPPQFDALRKNTTLVTLTLAGNDIGFDKWRLCAALSLLDMRGAPCRKSLGRDGTDPFAKAFAKAGPKFGATLRRIRKLSPSADIYVLGYPLLVPPTGSGCYPRVPIAQGDIAMLRGVHTRLNRMLAAQSRANGATYVDMSAPGHDMCQEDSSRRWIEPLLPSLPAAPLHPNANGAAAMTQAVLRAMRS